MPALFDDPTAIQRNRELMHAPWYAHADAAPWVRSLDGLWAFPPRPASGRRSGRMRAAGFDDGAWARIPVSANWELHGHGQPLYQNIAYPFHPAHYPAAPADNPTGFEVPAAWDGRRIFLEFGSVDSSFHCWVNGVEVGFSTDSKLPAHFDIAALVRPGNNHLAVGVYRWGTSSYLEKQDYWHLSGIHRSVRLVAKPAVHLRDWAHQVRFDAAFRDAHARRPGLDRAAARTLGADRFRHGPLAGGAPLDGCVPSSRPMSSACASTAWSARIWSRTPAPGS